jgi:integration host factor subunit beta
MEQLADAVAQRLGMSEAVVRTVLQASLDEIAGALVRDKRVQLTNFGVFELRLRRERTARNPRTGEKLTVPATVVVSFKASRALKARLRE